ncbi:MAG: hydrogenase maturation protease [Anaerolineae bacterium]|nr:hydrogenase maturation protease [Anaerolineae bacterium]
MSAITPPAPIATLEVEFTAQGYLYLSAEVAQQYFANNVLVALMKGKEMWLMPMRGAGGGGLFLKQRNARGDRSTVIWEVLPPDTAPGKRLAFWDSERGALRVAL